VKLQFNKKNDVSVDVVAKKKFIILWKIGVISAIILVILTRNDFV